MWALAQTRDQEKVAELFETPVARDLLLGRWGKAVERRKRAPKSEQDLGARHAKNFWTRLG